MLKFESRTVDKNLILKFSGVYPPGSSGNKHARFIAEKVNSYFNADKSDDLSSDLSAYIILDFSDLDYVSGDAIGAMAIPFLKHNRPLSIFATGRTKEALLNLARTSLLGSSLIKISDNLNDLIVK
jgi:hypothetical protein